MQHLYGQSLFVYPRLIRLCGIIFIRRPQIKQGKRNIFRNYSWTSEILVETLIIWNCVKFTSANVLMNIICPSVKFHKLVNSSSFLQYKSDYLYKSYCRSMKSNTRKDPSRFWRLNNSMKQDGQYFNKGIDIT